MIGSRILNELAARGHRVLAVVRDPSRVAAAPGVRAMGGDILNATEVARNLEGADAVISAYSPGQENAETLLAATEALLEGARRAAVARVLIVGGAASLFVAPGTTLLASGHLPKEWEAIATAHERTLQMLRSSETAADLEWTYFSPAAFIQPGQRTGKFRVGKDDLITDGQGQSRISAEDYAVALVDELENPKHIRQRFTVGY
jgi:putative NADH-flavin reductase